MKTEGRFELYFHEISDTGTFLSLSVFMKRFARYFISNSFVRDEYTCPDWNEAQKFDFAMKRYLTKPHKRVFPLSIPFMNDVLWKSNVASVATLWREKIQKS